MVYSFLLQSFLPLYSQIIPTCSGKNIVCPGGTSPFCTSGRTGFGECRSLPGFGFFPGCNTCTAFFPNEVICISSSGTPFSCTSISTSSSSSSSSSGIILKCAGGKFCPTGQNPQCPARTIQFICLPNGDPCCLDSRSNCSLPISSQCISTSGFSISSSSSTSSGGNNPACTNGIIRCASGTPACTNNRVGFAECRDLPGFGFIPGCNASSAFFSNEVSCFTSGLPPNAISSSGSNSNSTFCSGNKIFCLDGSSAACTNRVFTPTCVNGLPDCCKEEKNSTTTLATSLNCNFAFLFCPNTPLGIDQFSKVSIDVTSNPKFPEIIDLPLITDEFNNRVGYAYRGSNPSFEINFPAGELNPKIISADLRDSSGVTFKNIPSIINLDPNNTGKLILTLSLPENISVGRAHFALNLFSGDSLSGIIQIIDSLKINSNKKIISKPRISRIFITGRKGQEVTLSLRGKNFVGRSVFIEQSNATIFFENQVGNPQTFVTIFPTSLNVSVVKRVVSKDRSAMKLKLILPPTTKRKIKAVLVITTPRGTASKAFLIKNKKKS